jgi:hypothetical protein
MSTFKALSLGFVLAFPAWCQSNTEQTSSTGVREEQKHEPGAAREVGAGAGTVGIGAAKGAGDVAKGTAKGAADLVTLHPIDAGASLGKGAATAGKDVTVGTAKGAGKVTKGIGRAFKHLF